MLLSVIIPVYNAEKYLSRCLESVFTAVALSKVSAEVILVDNGSSDNSLSVAKKFANDSPLKIQILHCHTKGAAAVRNYGATKASGKYIWFVDADDTVTDTSVKLLIEKAEKTHADIVMMGATRVYPDEHTDYLSAVKPSEPDYKSRFVRYGAGPWQFLFLRSWWVSHGFSFKEGIIHEDMEMISSLILYTDKFAAVDKPLYIYYQNDDSVLHKAKWDPHYLDIFPALSGLFARFKEARVAEKYHDELEWFFIWNLLIDSSKDFSKFREGKVGFKKSREMLKKYFPGWRKNRFLRKKPLKLRIKVRLNYYK
ncbi:glycosyltransferase [Candidatus Saccharibacteria bacterium]|nr:glycosyltransferase [Candidatus Saccharibacteria bacterium]